MSKAALRGGFSYFRQPSGLTTVPIDRETGKIATEYCPSVVHEVFRAGTAPSQVCDQHQSYWDLQIAEAVEPADPHWGRVGCADCHDPQVRSSTSGSAPGCHYQEERP